MPSQKRQSVAFATSLLTLRSLTLTPFLDPSATPQDDRGVPQDDRGVPQDDRGVPQDDKRCFLSSWMERTKWA